MSEDGKRVAFIIGSASYDRVEYALTLAFSLAATGREVHILFAYGAVTRLKKGNTDVLGEETDGWVRERVRLGLERGSMHRVSELLANLRRVGARVYACVAAMSLHNLVEEDLVDEVDGVTGIMAFLEKVGGANIVYV